MNVAELIDKLQGLPGDATVVVECPFDGDNAITTGFADEAEYDTGWVIIRAEHEQTYDTWLEWRNKRED